MIRRLLLAAGATAGALVLHRVGSLARPDAWADPVGLAAEALRAGTIALGAYLAILSAAGAAADAVGSLRLGRLVERATLPALRRALAGAAVAGATITLPAAGALAAGPASTAPAVEARDDAPPTMHLLAPATTTSTSVAPPTTTSPTTTSPTTTPSTTTSPTPTAPPAPTGSPATPPIDDGTWVVEPGQSFWSIASDLVEDRLGRSPTDAEVVPAWRALIERNRSVLVVPDDPDLLFPGQRVDVSP